MTQPLSEVVREGPLRMSERRTGADVAMYVYLNYLMWKDGAADLRTTTDFANELGVHKSGVSHLITDYWDPAEARERSRALHRHRYNNTLRLFTDEQVARRGQNAYRNGIGKLDRETRRKIARRGVKLLGASYSDGRFTYDSPSEGAVAHLFERYLPGFTLQRGETFQVPVGQGMCRFDFLVENAWEKHLVEYHPPKLLYPGEFESQEEFRDFRRKRDGLAPVARMAFVNRTKGALTRRYAAFRREIAGEDLLYQDATVHVLATPRDVYGFLRSQGAKLPDWLTFREEFYAERGGLRARVGSH